MAENSLGRQDALYVELIDRLYHIERAFITRRHIKLHYSKGISKQVALKYIEVVRKYPEFFFTIEESIIWFISIELYSRFLAGSKRGLVSLVKELDDSQISKKLDAIKQKHSEIISFIKTQRDKYLAHADDVKWEDFPNIFDKEYDELLEEIKDLLRDIGAKIKSSRVPTISSMADDQTCAIFDDLLRHIMPNEDIEVLAAQYRKDVNTFLSS